MSAVAKPELVRAGLPENVAEAAIRRMEEDQHIIRGLRMQNERLKEERLNAELEASVAIAKSKFAQAQMLQRLMEVEKRCTELEDHNNRIANVVTGLVGGPTREEFDVLKNDYYAHSARENL